MNSIKKHIGFDDRWFVLLGIPLVAIIISLMIFGPKAYEEEALRTFGFSLIYVIVYWIVFRFLFAQYHKRFNDLQFGKKRIFYIITRFVVFFILVKYILSFFIARLVPACEAYYQNNQLSKLSGEISEMLMIVFIFSIYEVTYYFNRSRKIEIEKNKLEKITAEQKLNTLKNQVNPHFLFNSLNTLVTIIPEDEDQAIKFVHELSKTYRTILEVRDEKLISIEKEMEALHSYIYLLKTRFHGKIHIINSIPDSCLSEFILPISLQILIENAVKHNIVSKSKPLKIDLYVEDDYLVVKNNLQKKDQEFVSTKVGLTNIRSRYKFMTDKDVIVQETEKEFIVKLPIINNAKS